MDPLPKINALVIHKKPTGRLKTCLDPKDLNKIIKREHHPVPTVENITPNHNYVDPHSSPKLDTKQWYWNIKLDEESSYLTTVNTKRGRYRFLRMSFGLGMSHDIFQKKIDETYEKCMECSRNCRRHQCVWHRINP